jgi:hypothetical protein
VVDASVDARMAVGGNMVGEGGCMGIWDRPELARIMEVGMAILMRAKKKMRMCRCLLDSTIIFLVCFSIHTVDC